MGLEVVPVNWPGRETEWVEGGKLFISVPFTWCLPRVQSRIRRTFLPVVVGGPAVKLMPDYLTGCTIGPDRPDALKRVNPLATKTTTGCTHRCEFCAVPAIEGPIVEIGGFLPGPVVCDNNILAATPPHIERVVEMLRQYGWADFNQGLDAYRLDQDVAKLLASIGKPMIRLAFDHESDWCAIDQAYCALRRARIPKQAIRVYVLSAFDSGPEDAWNRCRIIERYGIKPLPMWFHRLDAMAENVVTEQQEKMGWSDYERRRLMQWFYQHKEAVA